MKRLGIVMLMALSLSLGGCAQQEQAQQTLITQISGGLKEVETFSAQRQQVIDGFYTQQRRALDEAFDADVKSAGQLDAPWVIEHRKAYAVGIEAMFKAQEASQKAHEQMLRDMEAIDQGLAKLKWISEVRGKWTTVLDSASPRSNEHDKAELAAKNTKMQERD